MTWLDATAQAGLVRRGEVSPRELAEAAIARIEAVNPKLDAVIRTRFDQARAQAAGTLPDGPFRGGRGQPGQWRQARSHRSRKERYRSGSRHSSARPLQ